MHVSGGRPTSRVGGQHRKRSRQGDRLRGGRSSSANFDVADPAAGPEVRFPNRRRAGAGDA